MKKSVFLQKYYMQWYTEYWTFVYIQQDFAQEGIFLRFQDLQKRSEFVPKMFTEDQRKWIVTEFAATRSPTAVRRKFIIKYGIVGRKKVRYAPNLFTEIFNHFQEHGSVKRVKGAGRPSKLPTAKVLIEEELRNQPQTSVRKVARKLDLSFTTTYRTMKNELHVKPFKYHRCQELTEHHKKQRLEFCRWISDNNIDPQKIIFTDEKWFHLQPHPNRQNTRFWSIKNPFAYADSIKQGGQKVMAWAAIVDGRVLPIVWFVNGVSVDSDRYLDLLKKKLWPAVRSEANNKQYFYQQDGAPCHCSNKCLSFLAEKFPQRLISRRTNQPWPAHSPDLSPLDFWFWGEMETVVYQRKPETLEDLKKLISNTARRMSEEKVRRAAASFTRRVEICALKQGGHFEAEL